MTSRRDTARVLPVSPDGAVLLLEELDPVHPDRPYWSSIGGGIDAGETPLEAAVREAREETGLALAPEQLLGPVLVSEETWTWNGHTRTGTHSWYAVALARDSAVSFEGLQVEELETVLRSGWLTADELEAVVAAEGPDALRPPGLPHVVRLAAAAVNTPTSPTPDQHERHR